jgi:hypothetical protein
MTPEQLAAAAILLDAARTFIRYAEYLDRRRHDRPPPRRDDRADGEPQARRTAVDSLEPVPPRPLKPDVVAE